jgi:hypothetical protein
LQRFQAKIFQTLEVQKMQIIGNCMGKSWVCPFIKDDPNTEVGEVSTGPETGCYFYQMLITDIECCEFAKTKAKNTKVNKFVKKGGRL